MLNRNDHFYRSVEWYKHDFTVMRLTQSLRLWQIFSNNTSYAIYAKFSIMDLNLHWEFLACEQDRLKLIFFFGADLFQVKSIQLQV